MVGILAIVLAIVSALGVVAVIQGNSARTERAEALYQRDQADARFREATSLRLNSEAESMLAGTRSGGSFRAYQQLTAARRLTQTRNDGPLVDALADATSLVKIVDTGAPVGVVAFSPDGTRIASGSDEGEATIRLWDTATGQPIGQPMTGNTDHAVTILAFSPDGSRIVSGCDFEDSVQLWDTATGQSVGSPFTANAVAFNADGTQLVSGSGDHTIRRWDSATGQPIGQPMTLPGLSRMAFNPDGTRLVSGVHSSDTVRLLDTATGKSVGQPMKGHADYVASIAFSPDGTRIVSGGGEDDTTIRLWDSATGEPIGQPMTGHEDMVSSLAFSPDGTQIVSGSGDDTIRLWDAATGEPIGQPITGHTRSVNSVAFSPDGTRIASGSWTEPSGSGMRPRAGPSASRSAATRALYYLWRSAPTAPASPPAADDTIRLWDAATGQPIGPPITAHTGSVNSRGVQPRRHPHRLRRWRRHACGSGTRPPANPSATLTGHTGPVIAVAFSPDGTRIATGGADGPCGSGTPPPANPRPPSPGTPARCSRGVQPRRHPHRLRQYDRTVRLWDAATGSPSATHHRPHGPVPAWRSAPTAPASPPGAPTDGAALGRGHRPTRSATTHRPHGRCDQRGVQPRRHPHRLRRRRGRRDHPTLGCRNRRTRRSADDRPRERGIQPGIQPRRQPHRLWQLGRNHPALAGFS